MDDHTPEPWVAQLGYAGPVQTVFVSAPDRDGFRAWTDADARRIVAAVNACAGIPTKDLETAAANPGGPHCRLSWLAWLADRLSRELEQAADPVPDPQAVGGKGGGA
jgi:hypothetical protein